MTGAIYVPFAWAFGFTLAALAAGGVAFGWALRGIHDRVRAAR